MDSFAGGARGDVRSQVHTGQPQPTRRTAGFDLLRKLTTSASAGTFLAISMGIRAGVALGGNRTYERLTYFLCGQKD